MAFNMGAFLGGAATGLVDRIEDDERKAEKKADRAYTVSESDRVYNRAKKDREQSAYDALAESLAVYYDPAQVGDIMSNGNGAAKHAITKGAYYDKLGLAASEHYNMPNNDIKNVGTKDAITITNPENEVGSVSSSAEASADGVVSPEGLTQASFNSRFTVIESTKEDKTIAAYELSLLNLRLSAGDDATKIAEVDAKEKIFLDLQRKKAESTREGIDPNVEVKFYSVTERERKINSYRVQARNNMKIVTGTMGELTGKLKGTNALNLAELQTAQTLTVNNTLGNKEVQMGREIKSITANAVTALNQYAISNYKKIPSAKIYNSFEELRNASGINGNLKSGDLYISFVGEKTKADGTVIPAQYMTGTYLGKIYEDLGLKAFLPASYLGKDWRP